MEETFPKYQWSAFIGDDKAKPQIVIRNNSWEDFVEDIERAKKDFGLIVQATITEQPSSKLVCSACGKPATMKSGTSSRGPWKGIFCSSGIRDHTKFL